MPTSQISHICSVVFLLYVLAKWMCCERKFGSAGKGSVMLIHGMSKHLGGVTELKARIVFPLGLFACICPYDNFYVDIHVCQSVHFPVDLWPSSVWAHVCVWHFQLPLPLFSRDTLQLVCQPNMLSSSGKIHSCLEGFWTWKGLVVTVSIVNTGAYTQGPGQHAGYVCYLVQVMSQGLLDLSRF